MILLIPFDIPGHQLFLANLYGIYRSNLSIDNKSEVEHQRVVDRDKCRAIKHSFSCVKFILFLIRSILVREKVSSRNFNGKIICFFFDYFIIPSLIISVITMIYYS